MCSRSAGGHVLVVVPYLDGVEWYVEHTPACPVYVVNHVHPLGVHLCELAHLMSRYDDEVFDFTPGHLKPGRYPLEVDREMQEVRILEGDWRC